MNSETSENFESNFSDTDLDTNWILRGEEMELFWSGNEQAGEEEDEISEMDIMIDITCGNKT